MDEDDYTLTPEEHELMQAGYGAVWGSDELSSDPFVNARIWTCVDLALRAMLQAAIAATREASLKEAAEALAHFERELSEVHEKLVIAKAVAASAEEMTRDCRTRLSKMKRYCAALAKDAERTEQEHR